MSTSTELNGPRQLRRLCHSTGLALCLLGFAAGPASSEDPLSAIDWLTDSVAQPLPIAPRYSEPATSGGVTVPDITVGRLDGPSPDAAGLLPPSVTGLPRNLWAGSRADVIAARIRSFPAQRPVPAEELFRRILLAETTPPAGAPGLMLGARVDALLARGAVPEVASLLDRAGLTNARTFSRSFDAAMLLGTEDAACAHLNLAPSLAPALDVRVFCLARRGDWNAAALTLRTGAGLGRIRPEDEALVSRFLDPELFEDAPPLQRPSEPTPLQFRLFEALGEPLSTSSLPLAFAHADLRTTRGWKARLTAAERLARSGSLAPNALLGLYSEREAAASGGVWERVDAIQRLDAALASGAPAELGASLAGAWREMKSAGLTHVLAQLYGQQLSEMSGENSIALRVALLSDAYEEAAQAATAVSARDLPLVAVAQGKAPDAPASPLMQAIADAFADPPPPLPPTLTAGATGTQFGEVLLSVLAMLPNSAQGDLSDLTAGLSFLRQTGLEDTARRTALYIAILGSHGG